MKEKTENNLHSVVELAEVFDLGAEEKVAELSKGEEDDEEHDSESSQILGTTTKGRAQLRHSFVEADVFEHLWREKNSLITNNQRSRNNWEFIKPLKDT